MDYEDDDTDSKKELEETFQALIIDASHEATDKNLQLNIDHYYTFFGQME